MAKSKLLNVSKSPLLKIAKSKKFKKIADRAGSIAEPILPGAKSAGLALAGKPGEALGNLGGTLGEVGYKTGKRALRTAKRFKGNKKQKLIAAARGARTGLRKSASDIADNFSGGLLDAAEAIPGAGKIKKKLGNSKIVKRVKKLGRKSIVSRQRFRTATAGVFSRRERPLVLFSRSKTGSRKIKSRGRSKDRGRQR